MAPTVVGDVRIVTEANAQQRRRGSLVYSSLDEFNQERRRRKWPSIILAALCVLFLSSAGGIALTVALMLEPVEAQGACLSRDFILYAALMSLLYIGLHIRAALQDITRTQPGSSHIYGNYFHATALLVARLSIALWAGGLVATAMVIARAVLLDGLSGKLPILNLLFCCGAL